MIKIIQSMPPGSPAGAGWDRRAHFLELRGMDCGGTGGGQASFWSGLQSDRIRRPRRLWSAMALCPRPARSTRWVGAVPLRVRPARIGSARLLHRRDVGRRLAVSG
jgi:hypothetical protein